MSEENPSEHDAIVDNRCLRSIERCTAAEFVETPPLFLEIFTILAHTQGCWEDEREGMGKQGVKATNDLCFNQI